MRDPELHPSYATISAWLEHGRLAVCWVITESPIAGAEGDKEFLIAGAFSG